MLSKYVGNNHVIVLRFTSNILGLRTVCIIESVVFDVRKQIYAHIPCVDIPP